MTGQYVIGIDLGTTNSVVAWTTLQREAVPVRLLAIPQLVAPHTVESRDSLPSFLYQATPAESASTAWALPWAESQSFAVGLAARTLSAEFPDRTISAA